MLVSQLHRILAASFLIVTALAIALAAIRRDMLARVYHAVRLFEPARIVHNFRSMGTMFQTAPVRCGQIAHRFERDLRNLPPTYDYKGTTRDVARFLKDTWTTGLIVLQDGRVVHEKYSLGNTAATRSISWSVAKSFISTLVGIAVAEGRIADIHRPVTDYVSVLKGSGYDGVSIRDVLQMSSGIQFNEDYGAYFSDINRLGRAIAFNTSLDEFVASLKREQAPGTCHHYVSPDTQVLGMLLRATTGETISSYLESRIWKRIGMESDAYWLVDRNGVELAFCGLNAVLRDYARLGQLYLNEGAWQAEQIVPAGWVRASVTPDAPHLQPGNPASASVLGYGYQWWIPQQSDGDYLAIGVYGQFVYVYPKKKIVIAKSSAYPDYRVDGSDKELETIALFRAIATHLSGPAPENK